MKLLHNILLTTLLTISIFSAVTYSACKKDKCINVVCLNQGTCDGGNCSCPTGYEGNRCQILSRDKFIFTYNGGDSCGRFGYTQYPIYLRAVLDNPVELKMKNFLNNADDSAICTIQSTDSFTFIGANNATQYSGYGTMRNDSLHMTYSVNHDTTSYSCTYFGQSLR